MAYFYAEAQGNRGATHRLGSRKSGAVAEVRSWHDGMSVRAEYNEAYNRNEYMVYFTSGSSGSRRGTVSVGRFFVNEEDKVVFQPQPRSLNGGDDIIY